MKRNPNIPTMLLILTVTALTMFYIVSVSNTNTANKQQFNARLGSHLISHTKGDEISDRKKSMNCPVSEERLAIISRAEPLIEEEPRKPWITLKRNIENMTYLPDMIDIQRGRTGDSRYVYVDVGARTYGSSIGGWFKKRYPTQGHNFSIYAIEADPSFYSGYSRRKDVTLIPYAAWVSDEKVNFGAARGKAVGRGGMGQIRTGYSSSGDDEIVVQGFDFATWLGKTVRKGDYVVMKMDVEGTEFDLLPRLFDSGGICLVDELFLECHYNRWQSTRPVRTTKFSHTYSECLDILRNLRNNGVLVHQWW